MCLLLFSEIAMTAHGQTLTEDFGKTNIYEADSSNIICTFDVTTTIQTDPNGVWIQNNTYTADWLISITYLNQYYNSDGFSIVFNILEYPILLNESAVNSVIQNLVNYEITLTPQK